jgi:hypothetical protein
MASEGTRLHIPNNGVTFTKGGLFMKDETDRVRTNTATNINQGIDQEIFERVKFYATQPDSEISQRIQELEKEWSMERLLETNASTLALTGIVLAATVNKKWLWLSGGVLGFLFLHGVQGWCPPVPILRRLGVRTRGEIDKEKYALKMLRGDLDEIAENDKAKASPQRLLAALEA